MNINKIILSLFCIVILATPVLATEYAIKIGIELKTVGGWSSQFQYLMNFSDSTKSISTPGGYTFIYYQPYDPNKDPQVWIKYSPTSGSGDLLMKNLDKVCIGDSGNTTRCIIDPSNSTEGTLRFTLLNIIPITTATINSTSDNPIYAYFYTDRESALRKDDSITFDAKALKASSDSGITYSGNTAIKEVGVYFKRLQSVPVSITVSSKYEPPSVWDNEKLKFTITKSDTYIFTVKYDITNPWGANTETINKYTLIVKGLEGVSSQIYSTAPYDVYVGDTKTVPMTEAGTFSSVNGATVTPLSNNTYNFVFSIAGTYNLIYTTSSGQTTVSFNAMQKPSVVVTPQSTATVVSGAQKQQTGEDGGILGIDNTWLGIGLVGLVLGIIYMRKNKGNGGHYEARKQVG